MITDPRVQTKCLARSTALQRAAGFAGTLDMSVRDHPFPAPSPDQKGQRGPNKMPRIFGIHVENKVSGNQILFYNDPCPICWKELVSTAKSFHLLLSRGRATRDIAVWGIGPVKTQFLL